MKLIKNKIYKIVIQIQGKVLTFTGKIISFEEGFITFKDKFDKILTYNLNKVISCEVME